MIAAVTALSIKHVYAVFEAHWRSHKEGDILLYFLLSDGCEYGPWPAWLTAATRNEYSVSGVRPVTLLLVCADFSWNSPD